jgi:hypothetical protein
MFSLSESRIETRFLAETRSGVLHFLQIGQIRRSPNIKPPDMASDYCKNTAEPAQM